ncbi:peroxiredoxin [Geobacter sp. AOG2]|uniref:peroxiredoxin family protein n=1 Tax=Geobacter sp. AOG2 TaxID=1566347 RepID=UPI001CC53935|nr:TlpA disulfide reductase family protein [Geobacter sp. AOG2]GFE61429.1 thiol:disulfide interchange protein [Geobacter sp. AOG2]
MNIGLRLKAITLCLSIGFYLLSGVTAQAARVNDKAPDFSLQDLHGHKVTLEEFKAKGNAVILNFWSTTCPPCVAEIPALNALYREMKANGLVILGIAIDSSDRPVRELANQLKIEYPVLLDGEKNVYFDMYGLFGQPISILVDRSGVVRDKFIGQLDWNSPQIRAKVQNLLKGR